ncbi:MAG: hypothetical protein RLZZ450_366 [Pseudomonadota bacterium]|jgi:hypothetical protein
MNTTDYKLWIAALALACTTLMACMSPEEAAKNEQAADGPDGQVGNDSRVQVSTQGLQLGSSCWAINSWTASSGSAAPSAVLSAVACDSLSAGTAWLAITRKTGTTPNAPLWLRISLTDWHMSGMTFQPLLTFAGYNGTTPIVKTDFVAGAPCTNTMTAVTYGPGVRCPVGVWDGGHCYLGSLPRWPDGVLVNYTVTNGQFSYDAIAPNNCPTAGSSFDGRHCRLAAVPSGSTPFVRSNVPGVTYQQPYYTYAPGPVHCPTSGTRDDGANCMVFDPPDTAAFVLEGALFYYYPTCPVWLNTTSAPGPTTSTFDGAHHCRAAILPAGLANVQVFDQVIVQPSGVTTHDYRMIYDSL